MITNVRAYLTRVLAVIAVSAMTLVASSAAPASADGGYEGIAGSGSSWAFGIIQPWIAALQSANALTISFNPNGSSTGRKDFAAGTTQFADSDIPYQGQDPVTGQQDASARPYVYLPVVAGGTAFAYHLTVRGKLVQNLRLSGETIAKIFTNKITNWSDPQITRENGGAALPNVQIKPVVRADGSGSTAQFTLWMDKQYPSLWRPFNGGRAGLVSIFPRQGAQVAVLQDAGVMSTIASSGGEGEIGYTSYSYPKLASCPAGNNCPHGYPVALMQNAAGYFVPPTDVDVAVALTQASINGCNANGDCSPNGVSKYSYLTQNLDRVYTYNDPRSYPLSSYSYMVIPSSKADSGASAAPISAGQRRTLAAFLSYSLCSGQQKAGPYGYSPLPLNLVRAAFQQVLKLGPEAEGGAVAGVDITNPIHNATSNSCANPTFVSGDLSKNKLALNAQQPLTCMKAGTAPCTPEALDAWFATDSNLDGGSGNPTHNGSGGANNSGGGTGSGGSTGSSTTPGTVTAPGAIDPTTGLPVTGGAANTVAGGGAAPVANAIDLAASRPQDNSVFGGVAVLELVAIVLLPGCYVAWLRRRKSGAAQ